MATAPVPVKHTSRVASSSPDYKRSSRNEMEWLLDRFTRPGDPAPSPTLGSDSRSSAVSPAVDITEDATAFHWSAELPGMTEKDVHVSLAGNTLVIRGEKRQNHDEIDTGYHLSERSYGEFQRSFPLPEGADSERVEAEFANAVLTVTVPKTARTA
jgi:HSP20 family protein